MRTAIFMLTRNTLQLCGIKIGGNDGHELIVLPQRGSLTGMSCSHPSPSAPSSRVASTVGEPFAVGSQCATAIESIPVQVEEVYTREVVVKVKE